MDLRLTFKGLVITSDEVGNLYACFDLLNTQQIHALPQVFNQFSNSTICPAY